MRRGIRMKPITATTLCVLLMLIACLGTSAQVATAQPQDAASAAGVNKLGFSERHPRYLLRPGDVFDVSFEYTPEFNQTVAVQPDGYISLRDVGDIYVAGLATPVVTQKIGDAYGKILNKPAISILLKDYEKPYFIADGQVGHPGKYELRGDTTVVQAVAMAGGFLTSAKHSDVILFRRVSDEWVESKVLDVKKMQNSHNLSEDVHLRPGDMVFVPKSKISKIQPYLPSTNFSMIPWHF
jgi:polysaccharide biosynthesis/export protein